MRGPTAALWNILDRYPQIDTANPILGYSPASMLAAKLDCIADPYRLAPRDYYGCHSQRTVTPEIACRVARGRAGQCFKLNPR